MTWRIVFTGILNSWEKEVLRWLIINTLHNVKVESAVLFVAFIFSTAPAEQAKSSLFRIIQYLFALQEKRPIHLLYMSMVHCIKPDQGKINSLSRES